MKNPHIIVGANRRCLCGIYQGRTVTCGEILHTLDEMDLKADSCDRSAINLAIASLVEDCDDTKPDQSDPFNQFRPTPKKS